MKLALHHAQTHCLHAAGSLSSAAWAASLYGDYRDLEADYLKTARDQLALALEELNTYEAQRAVKANAA